MKKELMALMKKDKKKGFVIWLNGFFPFVSEGSRVPAFAMGGLGFAALVIAAMFLFPTHEEQRLADLEYKFKQESNNLQERQKEDKTQTRSEQVENKKHEENQTEDLNEVKIPIEELRLNEEGNASNIKNPKSLNPEELTSKENKKHKVEASDQKAIADSDLNLDYTQSDQSISGNAIKPIVDLEEDEGAEEFIADRKSITPRSKEKAATKSLDTVLSGAHNLNSEFQFDNQMGNAMDLSTTELSEIAIVSERIQSTDTSVENSGALFNLSNELDASAKANESLTLIDVLYTAY
mgnify:CR=1 FL=1